MHTPHPHQTELYQALSESVRDNKRVIACAATGFGKSLVMEMICYAALAKGRTVLVITEADKIYTQLNRDIKGTININAAATLRHIKHGAVHLAMAQTLARRPVLVEQFAALGDRLIILNDEAHIGTATKLLLQLPTALLIGFTATPAYKWAKHLPKLYASIVVGKQPAWLVANGYLSHYKLFNKAPKGVDVSKRLEIGSNGDYTEESQERYFDAPYSHKLLVKDLQETDYEKCMVFCASIKSAEAAYKAIKEAGIPCTVQHSKRKDIAIAARELAEFKSPYFTEGLNTCISVGSMTKGFDSPGIDLIEKFRKTTSLPLDKQMDGRGSRKNEGKVCFRVHDWGQNYETHGFWDDHIPWEEMWNKDVRKKNVGVAPIKECPNCNYMAPVQASKCPNCGYVWPANEKHRKEIGELDTILVHQSGDFAANSSVNPAVALAHLAGRRLSSLSPEELATYAKVKNKKPYAARIARAREQEQGGYLSAYAKAMGYKSGWALYQAPPALAVEKIEFYDVVI